MISNSLCTYCVSCISISWVKKSEYQNYRALFFQNTTTIIPYSIKTNLHKSKLEIPTLKIIFFV
jgi:hypothetical protein